MCAYRDEARCLDNRLLINYLDIHVIDPVEKDLMHNYWQHHEEMGHLL